jgi:hypothetical protein
MANGVYTKGAYLIGSAGANLASADLRCLLVKSTYTFDKAHNFVSDVVAGALEISVGGYARVALTTKTLTEDDANSCAYLDADDVLFAALAAGQTVGGAVLYKYNAADASAEVIAFYDVADTPTNGGNITIQWATPGANGGVLKLAV